jgi:hypothetical protein
MIFLRANRFFWLVFLLAVLLFPYWDILVVSFAWELWFTRFLWSISKAEFLCSLPRFFFFEVLALIGPRESKNRFRLIVLVDLCKSSMLSLLSVTYWYNMAKVMKHFLNYEEIVRIIQKWLNNKNYLSKTNIWFHLINKWAILCQHFKAVLIFTQNLYNLSNIIVFWFKIASIDPRSEKCWLIIS